jgi:UDPglucose--hexose-1-phosphate uridylyltransferase
MPGDIVPESDFQLRFEPGAIRKDFILDRYTIFAPERAKRPLDDVQSSATCPFCAGHESETCPETEAVRDPDSQENGPGWRVRAVPNLYPTVRLDQPASGVHEVIIECPHHETSLANLPVEHLLDLVNLWRRRLIAHRQIEGMEYAVLFKNQGFAAGASLEHSHSQIMTLTRVPSTIQDEIEAGKRFFRANEKCIFCELIHRERTVQHRVIAESDGFLTVTALAGRFPFESWILPKTHRSHFEETTETERLELASTLHDLLKRLEAGLCDPPYNLVLHNGPLHTGPLGHFHWHFEIMPRLSQPAGFEWGTNWSVNLVPPEQAAEYLRSRSVN